MMSMHKPGVTTAHTVLEVHESFRVIKRQFHPFSQCFYNVVVRVGHSKRDVHWFMQSSVLEPQVVHKFISDQYCGRAVIN
jgi:hypothetical protein